MVLNKHPKSLLSLANLIILIERSKYKGINTLHWNIYNTQYSFVKIQQENIFQITWKIE